MNQRTPRLRMFAGPNGSGKSTLKSVLPKELLGIYLNPDEIEQEIRRDRCLNFTSFGVMPNEDDVLAFFANSKFLVDAGLAESARRLKFAEGCLIFDEVQVTSYFASVAVDYIRQKLLAEGVSFTFETVMSHPSKVEVLKQAQGLGYRTYLYFIATDDPAINISRVRNRVSQGGHAVPQDRIAKRYHRSLDLLMDAIQYSNRAYIFDNSTADQDHTWLAEITDGRELEIKTDRIPAWFKRSVWDKI